MEGARGNEGGVEKMREEEQEMWLEGGIGGGRGTKFGRGEEVKEERKYNCKEEKEGEEP